MKAPIVPAGLFAGWLICMSAFAADIVPTDVQMPGTQPNEISTLESPNKCDNCHGGYNSAVEPAHNWRGSMMAHAGRDPIFWATLAVAEQDFNGAGDLCLRCHSTGGWLAGRSTPTDGSGLAAGDSDGVECDYCHKLTNPDDSDAVLQGEMNSPFIANDGGNPAEGFYGSGMSSMWGGADKLGPYDNADARHQFMQSWFHRDRDFCGTCHDVSNPVTGDLAHNHGQLPGGDPVIASGVPGDPVDGKAAFNNPPYRYGIVERTFSEYKSGMISQTPVEGYEGLPTDLKNGVLQAVYQAATQDGNPNYSNPTATRYFSCQTCHMRPVTGTGANKRGVPTRTDLPLHDLTGGNYWMPQAIDYLNGRGQLRLGGGMTDLQISAMFDGAARALEQLQLAATLGVADAGDTITVRITNHTGHKLITGYPEGRRMWLNIKWYAEGGALLREDGAYGDLEVTLDGQPLMVRTILDLDDPNTKVYEAHMGMTQQWAVQLLDLGYPAGLALAYDRETGDVEYNLGNLAAGGLGSSADTFHFALNNTVFADNRIPPWRMNYAEAERRNALPVPATQYGCETGCAEYKHYDEVSVAKPTDGPTDAAYATIDLMYQPTSWEYIQFLALANDGGNAFLAGEGDALLDAWLNTGMAEPVVMASIDWGAAPAPCATPAPVLGAAVAGDKEVTLNWFADGSADGYTVYFDQAGKAQYVGDSACVSGACSFTHANLTNGQEYCYMLTATAGCESGFSNIECATPQPPGQLQVAGVASIVTGRYVKSGKGKNSTTLWETDTVFAQGEKVVFRGLITDADGLPLPGANFHLAITGPESANVSSGSSDSDGYAEATWSTQKPNGGGGGGTSMGDYIGTVTDVSAAGHSWDEVATQAEFSIGPP